MPNREGFNIVKYNRLLDSCMMYIIFTIATNHTHTFPKIPPTVASYQNVVAAVVVQNITNVVVAILIIVAVLKESVLKINSSPTDEGVLLVATAAVVVVTGLQHFSPSLLLIQATPPHVTDVALLTSSPLVQNVVTLLRTLLHVAFRTQQSTLAHVSVEQTTSVKTALIVCFSRHASG